MFIESCLSICGNYERFFKYYMTIDQYYESRRINYINNMAGAKILLNEKHCEVHCKCLVKGIYDWMAVECGAILPENLDVEFPETFAVFDSVYGKLCIAKTSEIFGN